MRGFEYYKATSVAQGTALLARYQEKASVLAGGSDLLSRMKDRLEGPKLRSPEHLIDITGIKELNYIKEQKNGLKIGAATTLGEIASSPIVTKIYPLLSQALSEVAVAQIRNVATLGGNLCQRPRCWYFRGRHFKECLRKGGDNCYAASGENQYHAVIGAEDCHMVCPSDSAIALSALNATVEIASPKGNRVVALDQFYVPAGKNVLKETALGPSEFVTSVSIPAPAPGSRGVFLKLKERQAFDFAIVSAAATLTVREEVVSDARVVLGGVAPVPFRARTVEAALKGKIIRDALTVACKAVLDRAEPLNKNQYKVTAARGVMEKALTSLV